MQLNHWYDILSLVLVIILLSPAIAWIGIIFADSWLTMWANLFKCLKKKSKE